MTVTTQPGAIHGKTKSAGPLGGADLYAGLLAVARRMFEPRELVRLVPEFQPVADLGPTAGQALQHLDPVTATAALAYDFVTRGGKHSRPMITLAAYDALAGEGLDEGAAQGNGEPRVPRIPDAVRRTAMSIEIFHKASLVHDDIEDDDAFRYALPTLHRQVGIPSALNVGDYLIGLGYRLVSREAAELGGDVAADVLDALARAHLKLAEGQGAELAWRDARDKTISPEDALRIYALKTAPAFEAALYSGLRMADTAEGYAEPVHEFCSSLGIAFQVLNDLDDWQSDRHNKRQAGGDLLGGRPTVLWALAAETLSSKDRQRLEIQESPGLTHIDQLQTARSLYAEAGIFDKAHRLVGKYRDQAHAIAEQIYPKRLRRLLNYLIDLVLEHNGRSQPRANDAHENGSAASPNGRP